MRIALTSFLTLLFLNGCVTHRFTDTITKNYDDIAQNTRTSYYNTYQVVQPEYLIQRLEIDFLQLSTIEGKTTFKAYFTMNSKLKAPLLEQEIYLKIDDHITKYKIENATKNDVFYYNKNTETVTNQNNENIEVITSIDEINYKIYHFSITLDEETVQKIRQANQLKLQFYMGSHVVYHNFSSYRIKRLKSIL